MLTDNEIEWLDGGLLGDTTLAPGKKGRTARVQAHTKHAEFAAYLLSGLARLTVCTPQSYNEGTSWCCYTLQDVDLYAQRQRWYPDGKLKRVPIDLRITPNTLRLWYLGDGMLAMRPARGEYVVKLCTEGFLPEDIDSVLIPKLRSKKIDAYRDGSNNVVVSSASYRKFFGLIGRSSPVPVYDYKFELPEWRFSTFDFVEAGQATGTTWKVVNAYVAREKIDAVKPDGCNRRRVTRKGLRQLKALLKSRLPKSKMRGANHPKAKATAEQISKIKSLHDQGMIAREIIERLGLNVTTTTIYRIVARI